MRPSLLLLLLLLSLLLPAAGPRAVLPARAAELPTGTIARGHLAPVPAGELVVGVRDTTLPPGAQTLIGGPIGFLVDQNGPLRLDGVPDVPALAPGAAAFVPAGGPYPVTNTGRAPLRFRFIGMGARAQVAGATYEMEPLPWGPGAGAAYDVTINREPFGANSATPWHYHTGPAFGVLDGGTWENREFTGQTRRIATPGYYIQPAGPVHQLAQVGGGGYALIVQFFPPGQSPALGAPGPPLGAPTVLAVATAIPPPAPPPSPPPALTAPAPTPTATRPAPPPATVPASRVAPVVPPTATARAEASTRTPTRTPDEPTPFPRAPAAGGPAAPGADVPLVLGLALALAALVGGATWWRRHR